MRLRYFLYILLFLTLSCVKEKETVVPEGKDTVTIPYTAVVQGSDPTRASIDGEFGTGSYVFQTGDKLYVSYKSGDDELYGALDLISGEGTSYGTFDGTLTCVGTMPSDETVVSATLVGPNAALYTISDGKITATTYPSSIAYEAGGLADYVKKYSHFTSSAAFGDKSFTLEQQTVFVDFSIQYITKARLTNPAATEIGISIKSAGGASTIRTFTGIPWSGGSAQLGHVDFIGVFNTSDNISSGQICVENCTTPTTSNEYDGNFAADQTLSANTYYKVTRCFQPDFSITAPYTGTQVIFNYYAAEDGIEYSRDNGATWKKYTQKDSVINLAKDEVIRVRGQRTDYKNVQTDEWETPAGNPIFTELNNKVCYISGNIMSLLNDEDGDETTIAANAFSGAFSKGTATISYIEINPTEPLILPATVLGDKCYKNMFRNCTNLTRIPELPATTVSIDCYRGMFRQCTKLTTVSIALPAPNLVADCYREMFRGCSKLASINSDFLPATNLAPRCYQQMFSDCKLTAAPALPATTLQNNCYDEMFARCTSLTTAPDLPAGTLVAGCYRNMFNGCTSLNYIKCLAANPNNGSYTAAWVTNVASSGTFVRNPETTVNAGSNNTKWPRGNNGIPSSWDVDPEP